MIGNYITLRNFIWVIFLLLSLSTAQAKECTGPGGGTGGVGEPGRWVGIGDLGNPSDTTGYGAVNYEYSMLERPVTVAEYVTFLNAVDPSGAGGFEGNLDQYGLVGYSGGQWQALAYTGCNSVSQSFSASDTGKMLISLVSMNQAARYANWVATGDINQGAYRFSSSTDGNASITSIDANYSGPRLPTENEYYKAAYWDTAAQQYNLYGTTSVDGSGNPLTGTLSSTGLIASTLHPYPFSYGADSRGNCMVYVQSGQGGRSAYGLSNLVGGFHDIMHTNDLSTSSIVLRPDNQFSNSSPSGDGSPFPHEHQRSTWRWGGVDPSTGYSSPSFRLVVTPSACGPESATSVDYGDGPADGLAAPAGGITAYGTAQHTIVSGIQLGTSVTADSSAVQNADDISDDGVDLSGLERGEAKLVTVYVPFTNGTDYLNAWIDWNGDGNFTGSGEQVAMNLRDDGAGVDGTFNDGQIQVMLNVPAGASSNTWARFRYSSDLSLVSTGIASDGEVEDYAITISDPVPDTPVDPQSCTGTNQLVNGDFSSGSTSWLESHRTDTSASGPMTIGLTGVNSTLTDAPWIGPNGNGVARSYVDNDGNLDDTYVNLRNETILSITNGATYNFGFDIQEIPNVATQSSLIGWALVDASTGAVVQQIPNVSVELDGLDKTGSYPLVTTSWQTFSQQFTATVPTGSYKVAMTFDAYLDTSISMIDFYVDKVYFAQVPVCDYSDSPADGTSAPVSGTTAYGMPRHVLVSGYRLGASVTDETGAVFNADNASDDGLTIPMNLTQGNTATITAIVNGSGGYLQGWIDWNGDGDFDDTVDGISEQISVNAQDNTITVPGRTDDADTTAGQISIAVTVPASATTSQTYARFRWSTTAGLDSTTAATDGEVEDYALTIITAGYSVSGRVFKDINVDAVNDSDETGVTQLPVVLYDAVNNTCISTRTDGNGNYAFNDVIAGTYQVYEASRERVPVPTNCGPTYAKNPGGYLSTTENVTAEFTVSTADITDQNFGDIKPPVFEPDNTRQVLAGNVVFYTHKLSTPTAGNVSFTSVNSGNVSSGWSSIIYQDVNCDGQLNGGDALAPVTGLLPVAANDAICLINKVYTPANVAANDSYVQKVTATFNYGNAIAGTTVLEVQDVTTAQQVQAPTTTTTPAVTATDAVVSQPAQNATSNVPATETTAEVPSTPYTPTTDGTPAQAAVDAIAATPEVGPSRLELRKTVKNTNKAPYTETATVNTAEPGDTLEYRIYYSNTGTGPVTDLVIHDTVPPYTSLVGTADCGTPPAGMGCTASALGLDDSLSWTFTGSLKGGSEGSVNYQVSIDK